MAFQINIQGNDNHFVGKTMRHACLPLTATGMGAASTLANVILLILMAGAAQTAYAADRISSEPARGGLGGATTAAPAGGRVTFIGAVVVGTAATPVTAVVSSGSGATLRTGRYTAPARRVTVRPLQPHELSPAIARLEFPGEHAVPTREAIVTYQ